MADEGDMMTALSPQSPQPPATTTMIMALPHELIEEILVLCDPIEVARVAMSCRRMYDIVYGGVRAGPEGGGGGDSDHDTTQRGRGRGRKAFWRALYLAQPLDDVRKTVNWIGEPRILATTAPAAATATTSLDTDTDNTDDNDDGGIDWQHELSKIIRARTVVGNITLCKGEEELREVLTTFLNLAKWVPIMGSESDSGGGEEGMVELSRNLVWVPVILKEFLDVVERGVHVKDESSSSHQQQQDYDDNNTNNNNWRIPPKSNWSEETNQIHAQLHVLYGLTRKDLFKKTRIESRVFVYDMRRYTAENEYGPLRNEAEWVDWVFLQRIHHLVSMHIVWASVKDWVLEAEEEEEGGEEPRSEFEFLLYPMSMPFTQTVLPSTRYGLAVGGVPPVEVPSEEEEETEEPAVGEGGRDWAGIEGTWAVCFCFIDHRDLIAFNISGDADGTLDTSLFEDEDFTEVFRRLEVTLHVTKVANDPEHPGRPIIGFVGAMAAPSTSTMYGSVQLTRDNHVKWQFYSGEMGAAPAAIWSSVGIQIGGIGSSFGVLGSWTTVFHDAEDPVGPFWMQKRETKQTNVNT